MTKRARMVERLNEIESTLLRASGFGPVDPATATKLWMLEEEAQELKKALFKLSNFESLSYETS